MSLSWNKKRNRGGLEIIDLAKFRASKKYQARVLDRLSVPISEIAVLLQLSECRIREIVRFYPKKSSRRKAHLWREFLKYEI